MRKRVIGNSKPKGLWQKSRKVRGIAGAGLIGAGGVALGMALKKPKIALGAVKNIERISRVSYL